MPMWKSAMWGRASAAATLWVVVRMWTMGASWRVTAMTSRASLVSNGWAKTVRWFEKSYTRPPLMQDPYLMNGRLGT